LYAAVSGRYNQHEIIDTLLKYSKNIHLPPGLKEYIQKHTKNYGKVKLVLKEKYFIMTSDKLVYEELMRIDEI
jgi:hypothetical protein